ncbi:MAG: hypothetical protein IJG37_03650 [Synergistaceae bacterium]|nr:hypothetical protein [Synergistaceae bacterium]MBQ7168717.1 hypothetical protein [Synergistaceae bacterium]
MVYPGPYPYPPNMPNPVGKLTEWAVKKVIELVSDKDKTDEEKDDD